MPPDLVRSTITSFADERIQVISQQVMTRAVLLELVDKYGLYEKYRGRATATRFSTRMRKGHQALHRQRRHLGPEQRPTRERHDRLQDLVRRATAGQRAEGRERAGVALPQREHQGASAERRRDHRFPRRRRQIGWPCRSRTSKLTWPRSSDAMWAACRIRRAINVQLADRTESELQRVERAT